MKKIRKLLAIALCIAMLNQNFLIVSKSEKREENKSCFTLEKGENYIINWIDAEKLGKDITINKYQNTRYNLSEFENYLVVKYAKKDKKELYALIQKDSGVPVFKDEALIITIKAADKDEKSYHSICHNTSTSSASLVDAKTGKTLFTKENSNGFISGFDNKVFIIKNISTNSATSIKKYDLLNLNGEIVDENNFDEINTDRKAAYKYSDIDKKNRDVYIFSEKNQKWIQVAKNQDSNSYDEFRFIKAPSGKITDGKAEMIEAYIDNNAGFVYTLDDKKLKLNKNNLKSKIYSDRINPYIFDARVYWNTRVFFDPDNDLVMNDTYPKNINNKYLAFDKAVFRYDKSQKSLQEIFGNEYINLDFTNYITDYNYDIDKLIMINKKFNDKFIIRDFEKVYADDVEIEDLNFPSFILSRQNNKDKDITDISTRLYSQSHFHGQSHHTALRLDKKDLANFKIFFKDINSKYRAIKLNKEIIDLPDNIELHPNQYIDYSNEIFVKNSDKKWEVHSFAGNNLKKNKIKDFEKGFDNVFVKDYNRIVKIGKDSWSRLPDINSSEKHLNASDLFYSDYNEFIRIEREIKGAKKYSYVDDFDKINDLKESDFIYKKENAINSIINVDSMDFKESLSHDFYEFKLDNGGSSIVAKYKKRDENGNIISKLENIYKTKNSEIYTYFNIKGNPFYYSLDKNNKASFFNPYIKGFSKQEIDDFFIAGRKSKNTSLDNSSAFRYIRAKDLKFIYYLDDENKIQKKDLNFRLHTRYGIPYSKRLIQRVSTNSSTIFNQGFVDVKDLNIVVPTKYYIIDGKENTYTIREKVGENTKLGVLKIKLKNTVKVKYELKKGDFVDSDNETNEFTVIKDDLFYLKNINHRSENWYRYEGLYLDKELTKKAEIGKLYQLTKDTVFYAKYKENDDETAGSSSGGGSSGGGGSGSSSSDSSSSDSSSSGGSSSGGGGGTSGGSSSGGGAISPTPSPSTAPSKPSSKNDKAKKYEKKSETVLKKFRQGAIQNS